MGSGSIIALYYTSLILVLAICDNLYFADTETASTIAFNFSFKDNNLIIIYFENYVLQVITLFTVFEGNFEY